jgi:hypothetical protein
MKQQEYITRVITPEEGHFLTQAEDIDIMQRVFSKEIFLAVTDSPANWKEITEDEANIIIAYQKEHNGN